jgi:hypothetical protein
LNIINTMNQKAVIYIILSAILLYLYYRRRDISIFAGFVVVVGATLLFRDRSSSTEGFSLGGGIGIGGGGKDSCKQYNFKKIDPENDLTGGLEKITKSIKAAAKQNWPYTGDNVSESQKKDFQKIHKEFSEVFKSFNFSEIDKERVNFFIIASLEYYDKDRMDKLSESPIENNKKAIAGGKLTLKILEKLGTKTLSKNKQKNTKFKETVKYLNCLCKYWISIYEALLKAQGAGGDDDGDGDGGGGDGDGGGGDGDGDGGGGGGGGDGDE